jgi:ankyrin repeat protein
MGKKKSKVRGVPSSHASVTPTAISEAEVVDACRTGDLIKLQRFGRQGVRVIIAEPLCIAVEYGFLVMRCLVTDLGADISQGDANGYTPLYVAAKNGHLDLLQMPCK